MFFYKFVNQNAAVDWIFDGDKHVWEEAKLLADIKNTTENFNQEKKNMLRKMDI